MAASPLAGRYDTAVDRESAREILAARAAAAAEEAQSLEQMFERAEQAGQAYNKARRYEAPARKSGGMGAGPSLTESLTRTVIKQLNTREGKKLVRGVLGSLFRGR